MRYACCYLEDLRRIHEVIGSHCSGTHYPGLEAGTIQFSYTTLGLGVQNSIESGSVCHCLLMCTIHTLLPL